MKLFNFKRVSAKLRVVAGLALATALAGCSTVPVQQPSTYLDRYRLSEIRLNFQSAQEPIYVTKIAQASKPERISTSTFANLGNRLTGAHQAAKRQAMIEGINAHVIPQMRDQLVPLFRGPRPLLAEVTVQSVYVESGFVDGVITSGVKDFFDGVRRPGQNQIIAGLTLYDQQSGLPIQVITPTQIIHNRNLKQSFGGQKPPAYGISKKLNWLAFGFARTMAASVHNNAGNIQTVAPSSNQAAF